MPKDRAMRAAFRPLRFLRRCASRRQRKFARRLASRHRRMRSEKDRNAGNTVVKIRAEAHELENLGSLPASRDRSKRRPALGGLHDATAPRRSCRLPRRKSPLLGATAASARTTRCLRPRLGRRPGRSRNRARILPDDLDLPGDILLIEVANTRPRAIQARGRLGTNRNAGRIAYLVSVAGRHEMRHIQRESAARSARCNGQSGSESFSQSASLAMKSACADQITPSSMVR